MLYKKGHRMTRIVTVCLTAVILSGCQMSQGGTLEKPSQMRYMQTADGCLVGAGTVGTSMDASFTYAGKYCQHPNTGRWHEVNADGTFGPTAAAGIIQSITGGMGAAAVQGAFGVMAAGRKPASGPAVVNQVSAGASAVSQQTQQQSNQSSTSVSGGCNGPCM